MNTLQTDFGDYRVKTEGDRHTVIWVDRIHNTTGGNGKRFETVELAAAEAKRLHEEKAAEDKKWRDSDANEKAKFYDLGAFAHKRFIKGYSAYSKFLAQHKEVGKIEQAYGHSTPIYRAKDGSLYVIVGNISNGASVATVPASVIGDPRVKVRSR